MEISELTFKIIMIFIPGAISSLIVAELTIHKEWTPFKFVVNSVILGLLSYLVVQLIYLIPWIGPESELLGFWQTLSQTDNISYIEILYASFSGVILGFILTYTIQKKWIFKIARKLKVSFKYGDECLYYYFLNAKDLNEVYVRDLDENLTYHGFIQAFSESDIERELVLTNVDVYRLSDSTFLYNTDAMFISKSKDRNWQIETPNYIKNNHKTKKDGKTNSNKRKN